MHSIEWRIAGTLPPVNGKSLGLAGVLAGVSNEMLIVGGGSNFPDGMPWLGGKKRYYDELYVFRKNDPDSLMLSKRSTLPFSLAYAASCSTSKGVIVAGGENEKGVSSKVLLLRWKETVHDVDVSELPDLPVAATNASAVALGNTVYISGGDMGQGVSDLFLSLDLDHIGAGWSRLPSLPRPVSHAVMVVQSDGSNDYIYLIGGRRRNPGSKTDFYSSTFRFGLKKRQWEEKRSLPYALSAGTGAALGRGSIILFGGDNGAAFHRTEELILSISHEKDSARKMLLSEEKIRAQSTHPGFCRQVLMYNTKSDEWTSIGCIPGHSPVTTTAVKWDHQVIIPGGEIRAGVRTPNILSAKILF